MLSDNDIDKLFKQAAAKQQPQFDAADWNDMAKRLEQSEQPPSYFNWISTVVLLGSVVWLSWVTLDADLQMKSVARIPQTLQEAPAISPEVLNESNTFDVEQQGKAIVDKDAMQVDNSNKKNHLTAAEESSTILPRDEARLMSSLPAKTKTKNLTETTSSINQTDMAVGVEMNSTTENSTTDQAAAVRVEANGTRKNSATERKSTDQMNSKNTQAVAETNLSTSKSVQKNSDEQLVNDKLKQMATAKTNDQNNSMNAQVVETNLSTIESVQKKNDDRFADDKSSQGANAETTVISSSLLTTTKADGNALVTDKKISTNNSGFLSEQKQITTSSKKGRVNAVAQNENTSDSLLAIKNDDKEDKKVLVTESEKPADSLNKRNWLHGLAIKATVSPDFSGDQFKSIDKAGFNYGVMLEYFIHDKFSVSSGAIWSRKYYSAQDVAYGYYQADEVYGDCRMWDIPLNVTYYNSPSKPYSFFFSVGASSYLMKEENYSYKIETAYGTVSYDEQVLKENNEWFKMLNLSIGVQKKFHKRWAFQVEPFIKVPLAGVGKGNIQLSSFGSFFSIRYKILDP